MSAAMDISAMSNSSVGSTTSDSTVIESEEERTFIELSELDKLLGLPSPQFDLGAAGIDSLKVLNSVESNSFDSEIDFTVPHKQSLPQRLRMELCRQNESETEVCYNNELTKVSVIKTEVNIELDGNEVETECNSYLTETVSVESPSKNGQDNMLYKRMSPSRPRGKQWGRSCKTGTLNRVVNKLLARSETSDDIILQNLLTEPQCLQPANSVCDNPIPKNPTIIPSPVINKLKKLGTSVEVEQPESLPHAVNGQLVVPETMNETSENPKPDSIPTGYLQIMESLDKAVGLTSDLTKKKKKRTQKRTSNNQVPSAVQLLAEIDGSDNLAKFSFQVDAKQVIELPEGQKLYTCDICSGVYHRGFSLKRHYLKTHINYKHISKRDLHNCGILFDPSIEKGGARKKQLIKDDSPPVVSNLSPPNDIPDLYRCHTCYKCFMLISDLQAHLMEHPPVSVQNLAEDQFKNYTCPNCKARYQKKKLFLRHKEICGLELEDTSATHYCLFCDKNFPTFLLKKRHHLQMHHPKKKLHQCYLCKIKMFKERLGVFKHLVLHHPDEYIGCLPCKLRFGSREDYKKHNKENHKPLTTAKKMLLPQKATSKTEDNSIENHHENGHAENTVTDNSNPNLVLKCTECPKMFASHLNMTRHRRLAHRQITKKKKKVMQKKETVHAEKVSENRKTPTPPPASKTPPPPPPPPPPPDPEVLFYSTIAHNIRENLTHHLDGKLDSQEIMEYDLNKATVARNKVLSFSASFTSENTTIVQPETSSVLTQLKEPRSTPISPRAQWEKFNFPKNYDGRCGLTSYIKDMSHLDISTQLTMRRNLQRLNSTIGQESNKESPANIPAGLLLVEKPGPDFAEKFGDPDDSKEKVGAETLVLSGEWVRPRTFLCAACGFKSPNLWDVEDHKYALHPNVWVPHIEIVGEQSSPWDWFYHRRLPPETSVEQTTPAPPTVPPPCSKCSRQCTTLSDLHRHMLDCGGDSTWMTTMLAVTSPGSRRRKWRPFGSRRRKQQGRRGLKRNIPNTPAKHSCGRIRTKPGDMDTIQKMIANLPAKRATRRVIGEDPDIKTRSQGTMNSVPISSLAVHSSSARSASMKSAKAGKSGSRPNNQKKFKGESQVQAEEKEKNKESLSIKEEQGDAITVKEEQLESDFLPLESENTIQYSDILTSLQMIPVVRKSPVAEKEIQDKEKVIEEEPIETSKILAAMREAMLDSDKKTENNPQVKTNENKKKSKIDERIKKTDMVYEIKKTEIQERGIIICNGCGMQFDNTSACQRHKKKCVYWKQDKFSEDNKTNKCVHCGSVFPYLMALLKHNCKKVEISEEPAMPELCPEKPVEEVQCDSVEEIPILSPVDISGDDIVAKRVSLLEETIREVGNESFDVSSYYMKFFNAQNSSKDSIQSPEQHQKKEATEIKRVHETHMIVDSNCKTLDPIREKVNEKSKTAEQETLTGLFKSEKNVSTSTPFTHKLKSNTAKQGFKSKKVSDIFKEVKRNGRRRQKIKVKVLPKVLATKSGLRKTSVTNSTVKTKKKQILYKKKRSSNFTMLMKEWEKLEKEGAVAVGKRKRVLPNPEICVERVRTRRHLNSFNSKSDCVESVAKDISRLKEEVSESTSIRRTRQTSSVGTINDISPEILKEITETFSLIPPEHIKKEELNVDIELSKRRKSNEEVDEKSSAEKYNTPNLSNEEHQIMQCVSVAKKKPGRPRIRSITVETQQHILETIDTIVKRSTECISDDVSKDIKQEFDVTTKKNLGRQSTRTFPELSPNIKTEEQVNETIEHVTDIEADGAKTNENKKWENIQEVIYNVSIGSADIFVEQNDKNLGSGAPQEMVKRKKGRKKASPEKLMLTESSENNSVINHSNEVDGTIIDSCNGQPNPGGSGSSRCLQVEKSNAVKPSDSVSRSTDENESEISPPDHKMNGKRKMSEAEEGVNSMNSKHKVMKTKQLSIADYLSLSHFAKKPSQTIKLEKDDVDDNKDSVPEEATTANMESSKNDEGNVDSVCSRDEFPKNQYCTPVIPKTSENITKNKSKLLAHKKGSKHKRDIIIDDTPGSPTSTSSTEDLALSIIREKVIRKKKRKLKLKRLLKNKRIEIVDNKVIKIVKPKSIIRDDRHLLKDKMRKGKKKVKVGVSRNRWEVSVVENENDPVEILCEAETMPVQSSNITFNEAIKKFYCSLCDLKFESSYLLYEHQLTPDHKSKTTVTVEQQSNLLDDSDPVKYCKSIGNIINDLEKHTLNVAKVMHHLKQRDSTESSESKPVVTDLTNNLEKEPRVVEESWQQEWPTPQAWSSRSTTPLWEGLQQTWEVDSFSTGCSSSLGSIMDSVNKLLSSDQEIVTAPAVGGYSWSDLQLAMGASDEEMAMLEQLGEHSLQEEYVYDNSRPAGEWLPPEDSPTFTDLDHQEQSTSLTVIDTPHDVKKQEPLSDSEDSKVCRGVVGRPRRLLGDYESREMVCPTCNKHFLGLKALQTHVSWSHCAPVATNSRLMTGLKRRALLSSEEVDRHLVCFVCKEIVASANLLEAHIQAQHTKKAEEQEPSKPVISESAEKLKSKMSLALGGLVDRALNKLLGTNKSIAEPTTSHSQTSQADLNSGALQLLGRLCAAKKRVGSENLKLSAEVIQLLGRLRAANSKEELTNRAYNNALANEMRQILSRGKPVGISMGVSKGALQASVNNSNTPPDIKPTNLLDHLAVCSSDVQERPYACPICDLRFLIPSTRNRHIARAHGKYGRRYDEEVEDSHVQDELESGWKDSMESGIEANDDSQMLPLCSDCGLSFHSIHEVMQHRIEDHPRRFSADCFQEDIKPLAIFDKHPIVESSSETNQPLMGPVKMEDVKMLPVSDNAIDSTSTVKKRRGRPAKLPDVRAVQKRKLIEFQKKTTNSCKNNRGLGKKKKELEDMCHQPENTNGDDDEDDDGDNNLKDDLHSFCSTSQGESSSAESKSPDSDKKLDKLNDNPPNRNSSEENLAELSKKLDRRKVRMGNMAEDAVRVKAEAALRELNLPRKNKTANSGAKWGINAMKFTKHMSTGMSSSNANGSPPKPRFASLVEKKWKVPTTAIDFQSPKTEFIDVKPDIYDFRDEDLDINKKPFQQFKEPQPQEAENSESNNLIQSVDNWNITGSPQKTSYNSKLSSDSS